MSNTKILYSLCQGFPSGEPHNQWTTADLIRSVNKKVRHNYIRRRLKVTIVLHTDMDVEL